MQPLQETDFWDPTLFHWGCLSWFLTKLASIAVARCWSADWNLFMVVAWQSFTTLSCSSGILECVYGTMNRRRWTNSMACSFLWFKSLRFLSLWTSRACYLCWRSQWHLGLSTIKYREFELIFVTPRIFQRVRQSLFRCTTSCVESQGGCFEHFNNLHEAIAWRPDGHVHETFFSCVVV